MHAKHQNTSHTPGLEHVRLDTTHHSHLQHLPSIPSATQPPHWITQDTPYTDRNKQYHYPLSTQGVTQECTVQKKQYHYPTPVQQLATTVGHPANTELPQRLEDSVCTPLYYSALRPDSLQAHLQKPQLQVAVEQVPLLTRYHHWYARRSIHVPAAYGKCICGHTKDKPWDDFKTCHLYRGLATSWTGTQPTPSHSTPDGRHGPLRPGISPPSSGRRKYSRRSAGGLSPLPSTPCYASRRTTPRPQQRTSNGRPSPKQPRNSVTAPTSTCSMQPPYPRQTRATSSTSCSANRETPPSNLPRDAGPPTPSPRTIHRARHLHGMHQHERHRIQTRQHTHTASPHCPKLPSVHRYRQPPATASPVCVRQQLPQTALPCNTNHWVCLGAAHRLTHCPNCGDLNPHHRAQPATPGAPQPASHPSFFKLLTNTLQDYLGGHYAADLADDVWTIAMTRGAAPLALRSPTLRHSGGSLNLAACHIVLAKYLHHRYLCLLNPQLPAPPRSSSGTGSVGGDGTGGGGRLALAHLPPFQHRFRPAERTPLPNPQTLLR